MLRPIVGVGFLLLFSTALAAPRVGPKLGNPDERARERAAVRKLTAAQLAAHTRFLGDDLLEGRAPATPGDELAMRYVAAEMERLGLEPYGDEKNDHRSWVQRLPIVSLRSQVIGGAMVKGKAGELTLRPGQDTVVASARQEPSATVKEADLVFVGYGIVAPEEHWDDYAGIDVRGKVVIVLNNDPSTDPKRFGGVTRLYYGRWDYKYAEAARHGAAGAIIVHTEASAGYPWQVVQTSWGGTSFELPAAEAPRMAVRMWVTEERANDILRLGGVGETVAALMARAERPGFTAVPLRAKLSTELKVQLARVETGNVMGFLPGTDPLLKDEVVIVTAHHDHLGRGKAVGGDDIYNGALDNASGVAAMLTLAEAVVGAAPRRSILFAAVGAEESGLLGSEYLCAHLPVPSGKVAANLNIDGINIWGRTRDVTFIGFGKSSLDKVIEGVAAERGRVVVPDQFPDRGSFYRSDQFNFARLGIPALHLTPGTEHAGHDRAWGQALVNAWVKTHYHQPSDQIDTTWQLDGAVADLELELVTLLRVANAAQMPTWKAGDEFEAARLKAVQK